MTEEKQGAGRTWDLAVFVVVAVGVFLVAGDALAGTTSGNLPWHGPLQTFRDSMSGPVAFGVSMMAVVGGMAGLVFGGDVQGWIRQMLFLAVAIGTLGGIGNLLTSVFHLNGALVL